MDNEKIGRLIAKLRNEQGLTQQELGDKVGVGFRAVSKWERGITLPDIGNMNELSKILGITLDELLAGERKEKNESQKKISPTVIITISIISVIILIITSLFLYHNNKTYVYDMVSIDKDDYYIEGQVTFHGSEISIILNKLNFKNETFYTTKIKNYEYEILSKDNMIFGYGKTQDGSFVSKEKTIEAMAEEFRVNYTGEMEMKKKEILENNVIIVFKFTDVNDNEIIHKIEFKLYPLNTEKD